MSNVLFKVTGGSVKSIRQGHCIAFRNVCQHIEGVACASGIRLAFVFIQVTICADDIHAGIRVGWAASWLIGRPVWFRRLPTVVNFQAVAPVAELLGRRLASLNAPPAARAGNPAVEVATRKAAHSEQAAFDDE